MVDIPLLKSLGPGKRAVLSLVGLFALLTPIAAGILSASTGRTPLPAVLNPPALPQLLTQAMQTPGRAVPRLGFDSATVQPESPGVSSTTIVGGPGTRYPGEIVYSGITLRRLLARAYIGQIDAVTGPDWLDTDKWYIVAEVPRTADLEQSNTMLRNLLAERFHLRLHEETRSFTGYALQLLGDGAGRRVWPSLQLPADAPLPTPRGDTPKAYGIAWLPGMDDETADYDPESDTPRLIDRTGKPGTYDSYLSWMKGGIARAVMSTNWQGDELDSLIERILGAKVKVGRVQKVPLSVLVIDHAEKVSSPK